MIELQWYWIAVIAFAFYAMGVLTAVFVFL
jgi:hypothetical protein